MSIKQAAKSYIKKKISESKKVARGVDNIKKQPGLVVLMFHKVSNENDPFPLTISPGIFSKIIEEIKQHHNIVSLHGLDHDTYELSAKSVLEFVITFDDGYQNNYKYAYPILKQHNVPAVIYLSTSFIDSGEYLWYEKVHHAIAMTQKVKLDLSKFGHLTYSIKNTKQKYDCIDDLNVRLKKHNWIYRDEIVNEICLQCDVYPIPKGRHMLNWDEIREMAANGIDFGSHTVNHPILSREDDGTIKNELFDSKQKIVSELNIEPTSFAYPNGTSEDYNNVVIKYLKELGYKNACTTIEGVNEDLDNLFEIKRVNIFDKMCSDKNGKFNKHMFWAKTMGMM